MSDYSLLRSTFNTVAREYDAIRPGYPEALIQEVISLSDLPPGGRCLEVGCGTGQATLPFAVRGYRILSLDIGADMLSVAREKFRPNSNVRFQQTSFENWQPDPEPDLFDLVFSATAFHWVPAAVGYPKAASVLKPGGALAVFDNRHPVPKQGFFVEVDAVYRQYDPGWKEPGKRRSVEDYTRAIARDISSTGLYADPPGVIVRRYPWTQTYTTEEYLRLINTYSNHLALPTDNRKALYHGIADLIERRYRGKVGKEYLAVLNIARTKAAIIAQD
jgi:SAM-dependent methyltransferase